MKDVCEKIRANPKFHQLKARRNMYALVLTVAMMIVYYGFILLVAFDKELLATKIGVGYAMSLGVPLGLGVILFTILITAVYVHRANKEFDVLSAEIVKEASQ